jgi:hypothetical protein
MERPRRPARPRRKPPVARKRRLAEPGMTPPPPRERPRDPDPSLWAPPQYDHVVDYRESLTSDFEEIAAEHPRSAVLGGFLMGVAVGLAVAWAARRADG